MNFNAPLLRPVRMLLFPFSLIYGSAVWLRNKMFDKGLLSSASFNLPVIGVGNLSAGGTGKSPMVEFIAGFLSKQFQVAVLSRGYKRKTKGYALARPGVTALEIGDEPMQFFQKFPHVAVAVGEERVVAIPQLLHDRPDTEVIILDDAFQHRYVQAGYNVLLTDCSNLFTRDWFLPTGDLRDLKESYRRANVIVVTKCNPRMTTTERDRIIREIRPLQRQQLFFTTIEHGIPRHILSGEERPLDNNTEVLLVTGIANPRPLKKYIGDQVLTYYEQSFADHHIFTIDDWKDIRRRFEGIAATRKIILTTEKDAMRLAKFSRSLESFPVYVMPMQMTFLFGDERRFTDLITTFITSFSHQNQPANA